MSIAEKFDSGLSAFVRAIPPGESCGIGHPITDNSTAVRGNIRIVRVKTWR